MPHLCRARLAKCMPVATARIKKCENGASAGQTYTKAPRVAAVLVRVARLRLCDYQPSWSPRDHFACSVNLCFDRRSESIACLATTQVVETRPVPELSTLVAALNRVNWPRKPLAAKPDSRSDPTWLAGMEAVAPPRKHGGMRFASLTLGPGKTVRFLPRIPERN